MTRHVVWQWSSDVSEGADDVRSKLLWNEGQYIPDYVGHHPGKQPSLYSSPWEPELSPLMQMCEVKRLHTKNDTRRDEYEHWRGHAVGKYRMTACTCPVETEKILKIPIDLWIYRIRSQTGNQCTATHRVFLKTRPRFGRFFTKKHARHIVYAIFITAVSWHYHQVQYILSRLSNSETPNRRIFALYLGK
jgi:hypothetical protein